MNPKRLLRHARRQSGLTQRALAEAAGVPQSTVGRIELGVLSPRFETMDRLLRAAGQSLELAPELGRGIDRSLIRDLLRLSPGQRVRLAAADAEALRVIRRGKP